MNTDRLIKYLKNDLSELTEIFNELEPGTTLSPLEIKMILNRINSVNEEFELLENEIGQDGKESNSPKTVQVKTQEENKAKVQSVKEPETYSENIADVSKTPKEKSSVKEQNRETIIEPEVEPEEVIVEESETTADQSDEEPVEEALQEETPVHVEEEEINAEQPKTISDKYQGSTSSLNEHIANHIEIKDLASKLQQNPIDDLTKAIKLNDKIWYSNELFGGNLDLYRETIRTINKMEELEEALDFLESNFQFEQQKKSFKSFIEMIYRRFLK